MGEVSHFKFDANRVTLPGASDLKLFVGGVYYIIRLWHLSIHTSIQTSRCRDKFTHWCRDKMDAIRRRHFKVPFLEWKCSNSDWVSISSGNGVSPVRRQSMTWTKADLVSIGLQFQWNSNQNSIIFIQENAFEFVVCQDGGHFVQGEMS